MSVPAFKNGPPSIAPAALWVQLQQLPRPFRVVDYPRNYPGTDTPIGQVRMHVLTQQEQTESAIAAEEYTRKNLSKESPIDSEGYQNVYKNASAVEVLYRACRRAEPSESGIYHPFFPSPKAMRETLTTDEVGVLVSMYFEVQTELGPIVAHMTSQEKEAWIDKLTTGGSSFPLALLSPEQRSELLMYMAYQLRPSPTDTSSAGLQPSDDTSSEVVTEDN